MKQGMVRRRVFWMTSFLQVGILVAFMSQNAVGATRNYPVASHGELQLSLEKDWKDTGARGAFQREVRDGACKIFSVVLSPDYNPNHSNHFHMDMSFVRFCR